MYDIIREAADARTHSRLIPADLKKELRTASGIALGGESVDFSIHQMRRVRS